MSPSSPPPSSSHDPRRRRRRAKSPTHTDNDYGKNNQSHIIHPSPASGPSIFDLTKSGGGIGMMSMLDYPSFIDPETPYAMTDNATMISIDNNNTTTSNTVVELQKRDLYNRLRSLENENERLRCQLMVALQGASIANSDKSSDNDDMCYKETDVSFTEALKDRAYWLIGLLAFQSCSGFILSRNEILLQTHPVIVYFLTMLVGAGGNAGNQASVRVIRSLALGTLNDKTLPPFLQREFRMALSLSVLLSMAGFIRAVLFLTPLPETVAVTASLALIVFSSICLGAVLPLGLRRCGIDPAHSSTTIQVVMDISGVWLTVLVSSALLDTNMGKGIIQLLSLSKGQG